MPQKSFFIACALPATIVFAGVFLFPAKSAHSDIAINWRDLPSAITVPASSYLSAIKPLLSPPIRIIIPAAKTNAPVIPVGVTPRGNLDTPPNFIQAGWYSYGAMPGQTGSAVIDGHVDNGLNIPGPFKHLQDVAIGDRIEIDTVAGAALYFSVIRTDVYKTADFPSESIFHDNSGAILKIITCYGHFLASQKTYDRRLVVTAVLDQSPPAPTPTPAS